jgi:predicted nucleic acid-binding protein
LRHRHGLTAAEIDDLVDALSIQAEIIDPLPAEEPRLRDAADELVLDTLLAALHVSKSDYLITGDKDLLAVADRYPILTPAQFWSGHGGP